MAEIATLTHPVRLSKALDALQSVPEYPAEYERFVRGMSYASEGETPDFFDALAAATRLAKRLSQ